MAFVFILTDDEDDDEEGDPCLCAGDTTPVLDAVAPGAPPARPEGSRGPVGNGGRDRFFGGGAGSIIGASGIMLWLGTETMLAWGMALPRFSKEGVRRGENSCGV